MDAGYGYIEPGSALPWGFYESLIQGDRFQVKRIMVTPGQKLSLQKHYHRAEHWVVVAGSAIVTWDNVQILLRENESIYLPLGCVHRLENPGCIPLTLIETQSSSYLGENDSSGSRTPTTDLTDWAGIDHCSHRRTPNSLSYSHREACFLALPLCAGACPGTEQERSGQITSCKTGQID